MLAANPKGASMSALSKPSVLAASSLLLGALFALPALAQEPEIGLGAEAREALSLTVYNQDLALVVERRRVELPAGAARLRLSDVSPRLQPGSVNLYGPDLRVLELSSHFDLLTPYRLLEASLGKTVRLARFNPMTGEETIEEAKVLSVQEGVVLKVGDRIEAEQGAVGGLRRIIFDEVPAGLAETPTLSALVESQGGKAVTLSYLTGGLTWQADYIARLDEAAGTLAISGLATLTNTSLTGYADARLRLVAGAVNRAGDGPVRPLARGAVAASMAMAEATDLAPEGEGELYVYDPGRAVSLLPRETKQIALLSASEVPFEQEFRLEGLASLLGRGGEIEPVKAQNLLRFKNEEAGGLGKPLPAGVLRAYGLGGEAPLFLGEDRIRHTARGQEVEVALGQAFDVTGEARQTAFEQLAAGSFEAAQEVTLRNAKARAVTVKVTGDLPPGWKMLDQSADHETETATRVAWTLEVPAGGETALTYRVRVVRP